VDTDVTEEYVSSIFRDKLCRLKKMARLYERVAGKVVIEIREGEGDRRSIRPVR
jgi:hypothetical protein